MSAFLTAALAFGTLVGAFAGAKAAGDWLSSALDRRRQDDRDHDNLYGFTDSRGVRHPGAVERLDDLDTWRTDVDAWRSSTDRTLASLKAGGSA